MNEPTILTVKHLRAAGVSWRAIENFHRVFPYGMPCTEEGLLRATCMNGSYLAAIDKMRKETGAGVEELRQCREAESEAREVFKATWAVQRRAVLAAAMAKAVRNLPKDDGLLCDHATPAVTDETITNLSAEAAPTFFGELDINTVIYLAESDDCEIGNS